MNNELLKNEKSILIHENMITNTYNYNLLNNILSILGRYNYTLSIKSIDIFCRLDWNYRVKLLSNISKTLYEEGKKEGIEISNFYVNYPNEVKSQDKRELYINSLLYFYHNFWNGIDEETLIDKPELTEDISLTELDFVTKCVESKEKIVETINKIEDDLGIDENEVMVSEDEHYNQMGIFEEIKLDIQEEIEEIEEEKEIEEINKNQLNIFEEEVEEEYSDINLDELEEELNEEEEEEIDELEEELEEELVVEEMTDKDFEEEFINPYEEEIHIDNNIKLEDYPEVEEYNESSVEEVQENIEEFKEEYIELIKLDETPSEVQLNVMKKFRRTKDHIDNLIEDRKYIKLIKNLKKEPNELSRRIIFILEGITYKYEKKEERIGLSSKALGLFEGIVDEVSYDILTDIYKNIKYREQSYLENNLQKSFKELKKIIKEEIRDRKNN